MLALPALGLLLSLPLFVSANISYKLENFIKITPEQGIEGLLSALLYIFITVATPIVILFIIYAGFLYVTARGNAQQIEQATKAFTYAVIGGVIILGSVALGEVIKNVVNAFKA